MDNTKKVTKLLTKYTFYDSIDRVFEVLTNFDHFQEVMSDHIQYISFKNGNSLSELNTELSFTWGNEFQIHMRVINVINKDSYKSITLRSFDTNIIDFDIIHSLFWDSIASSTLYSKQTIIRQPNKPMSSKEIEEYKQKQLDITAKMKKRLEKTTIDLLQNESIIIDLPVDIVWATCTDWTIFSKLVPELADEVVYRGSPDSVDTVLDIKTDTLQCKLKVIKCERGDAFSEFVLESISSYPFSPMQDLIFNFHAVDGEKTYLAFKHKFKEAINYKYLNALVDNKKKMLVKLKNELEKELKPRNKSSI
jgi:hypothetical protein